MKASHAGQIVLQASESAALIHQIVCADLAEAVAAGNALLATGRRLTLLRVASGESTLHEWSVTS